ncbi:MAG TPA: cellulose synthase subunit BcsC-related outer membrane protein [Rhodocyclaceae bacterium]
MRRIAAAIACALPLLAAAAAAPAADPAAVLLDRARLWEERGKHDLARETLQKLFRMAPDHPGGLAELGVIEAHAGRQAPARAALEKLRRIDPAHPGIARVEAALRAAGIDKEKLRMARQLAEQSRLEGHRDQRPKALAAYRALFPGGRPEGDLALEYWRFVGEDWNRWNEAYAGLLDLARRHPDNLHYKLALAAQEASRSPVDRRALQVLIDMTQAPELEAEARAAWRRVVMALPPTPENRRLLEQYLDYQPKDVIAANRLKAYDQAADEQRRLLADPGYRARIEGQALLDRGDAEGAARRLAEGLGERPHDPELAGTMGIAMLRLGRHAEAQEWFGQALRGQPAQAQKWRSLIATARYWGLLREAGDARDAHDLALAEAKLREAMRLDAREAQAYVALARIRADQRRFDEADADYLKALSLDPANRTALGERLELLVRTGRADEARRILASLPPARKIALGRDLGRIEAGMLRAESETLLARGRRDEAAAALERAVQLDADDPWLRFDLARLYVAQGRKPRALALFDDLLSRRPDDPAALYAAALVRSSVDDDLAALLTLERIKPGQRDAKVTRTQRELWLRVNLQRARSALAAGRTEDARRRLQATQQSVAGDDDLTAQVALAWDAAGATAQALHILEAQRASGRTLSVDWRLAYATVLQHAGENDGMERVLGELPATLEPAQAERAAQLREAAAVVVADAELRAGRPFAARDHVQQAIARIGERPALLRALARAQAASGDHAAAAATLRRTLAASPRDAEARRDLAELLAQDGRREDAIALIKAGLAQADAVADDQLALLGLLVDLDALDAAREAADSVLKRAPGNPRALLLAGRLALADDRPDDAIDLMRRGLAAESAGARPAAVSAILGADNGNTNSAPETRSDYRYRRLAELIDERSSWLAVAADRHDRVGTPGYSQYLATEIPIEYVRPLADRGRGFFRAGVTELNAGRIDLNDAGAMKNFGGMALCRPNCADPGEQRARGTTLGVGYQKKDFRADFGTTPIGFPVTHWVGGVADKFDLGAFSASAELARRPVIGSMLSYAGTRDPYTGRVWGGVVATGLRLGLSRDAGGALGFWSSLGLHRLTGQNVEDNRRQQLMAGAYWRVINRENQLLSIGLTGMDWRFARDAGEYTFGHGGYYSPARYSSLALPLTYGERFERFSYMIRGAVSSSRAQTAAAPYYPTDAGMMAAALAAGIDPYYSASQDAGKARGRSFHVGWEYQLDSRMFIGGRVEIERSPDYAPNRTLLYLRWNLDRGAAQPVPLLPDPYVPYSQF